MSICNLLDDFLSRRRKAEETLSILRQDIRQIESEHLARGRQGAYSLSRQGDTLARITQLRDWAEILSDQLRAK